MIPLPCYTDNQIQENVYKNKKVKSLRGLQFINILNSLLLLCLLILLYYVCLKNTPDKRTRKHSYGINTDYRSKIKIVAPFYWKIPSEIILIRLRKFVWIKQKIVPILLSQKILRVLFIDSIKIYTKLKYSSLFITHCIFS